MVDPDGVGPRIVFLEVPEAKVVKNRVHLDLSVSGGHEVPMDKRRERIDAEAGRLVAAGATKLRVLEATGHYAWAMHDPEGNEFDLN
ncbi:MAG: VOC family protein [Nocardioidaceae bacterium]